MVNVRDRVRKKDDRNRVAIVDNVDCRPSIIIKYDNGEKEKVLESDLIEARDDSIRLTPERFDETVKALMYATAEDVGDTDKLDGVLEIIGAVCAQLKARLFDGRN